MITREIPTTTISSCTTTLQLGYVGSISISTRKVIPVSKRRNTPKRIRWPPSIRWRAGGRMLNPDCKQASTLSLQWLGGIGIQQQRMQMERAKNQLPQEWGKFRWFASYHGSSACSSWLGSSLYEGMNSNWDLLSKRRKL